MPAMQFVLYDNMFTKSEKKKGQRISFQRSAVEMKAFFRSLLKAKPDSAFCNRILFDPKVFDQRRCVIHAAVCPVQLGKLYGIPQFNMAVSRIDQAIN